MITSCCGTLFGEGARNVAGDIASLPPRAMEVLFFLSAVLVLRSGAHLLVTGRGATVFGVMSFWQFWLSLASVIAFISVYYYELPTHHCPFDILQKEYHYIGYPLYAALVVGGIFGTGVGVMGRFGAIPSLARIVPNLQKRFCLVSMDGYIVAVLISIWPMIFSEFRLIP